MIYLINVLKVCYNVLNDILCCLSNVSVVIAKKAEVFMFAVYGRSYL